MQLLLLGIAGGSLLIRTDKFYCKVFFILLAMKASGPHLNDARQAAAFSQKLHFRRGKEKQLTAEQIAKREADVQHTKKSTGFARYSRAVAPQQRRKSFASSWHPQTPSPSRPLSVRQWRDVLAKWRHQVHAWANLPEAVYDRLLGMTPDKQLQYLASLHATELDDRDDAFSSSSTAAAEHHQLASSSGCLRESRGMSSEQLAHHLLLPAGAAAVTRSAAAAAEREETEREEESQRPAACRTRPVLFLPSWFHTLLHRKGFDVVHEKDIQSAATILGEQAAEKTSADTGVRKTSCFLSSVYGAPVCAAFKEVAGEHAPSTAAELSSRTRQLQHDAFNEADSMPPERFKNLPLDLQFRLQNRLPPLVGVLRNVRQRQTHAEASSNSHKAFGCDEIRFPVAAAVAANGPPDPRGSNESTDTYAKRRAVLQYLRGATAEILPPHQPETWNSSFLTLQPSPRPPRPRRKRFT